MTDKPSPTDPELNTPSDAEIIMLDVESGVSVRTGKGAVKLTRAGLAKWGQPAPQPSHVAQAAVPADLITIRKPTTSAETLWLLKLARLVISDVDKTLEKTFAPAQPAAQQGVAYAASLIENLHL